MSPDPSKEWDDFLNSYDKDILNNLKRIINYINYLKQCIKRI